MRKSLVTLTVSLLLCGGAAAAVIATADQAPSKPVRVAMVTSPTMRIETQAPSAESGRATPAPGRGRGPAFSQADRSAQLARLCQDRYARMAGELAYLEARIDLTPQQSAAFARWRTVRLDTAKRQASTCAARPVPAAPPATQPRPTPPSPVERMAREQSQLQQRLADIQAERPALEALYNVLTPAQRQLFVLRPAGMMGHGFMAMRRGPMMRGPMRRGPMMQGPRGRGPGLPPGGQGQNRQSPPPPQP